MNRVVIFTLVAAAILGGCSKTASKPPVAATTCRTLGSTVNRAFVELHRKHYRPAIALADKAIADVPKCDDDAMGVTAGGYANTAKFMAEHALRNSDWQVDYRLADMLLEKCLTHQRLYATKYGAQCERTLHDNIRLAGTWERDGG